MAENRKSKSRDRGRRVRSPSRQRVARDAGVLAVQVGSDLRESAHALRSALDAAVAQLSALDSESAVTIALGRIAEQFHQVHDDISAVVSNLASTPAAEREVLLDPVSRA